jgi:hypothetical protein
MKQRPSSEANKFSASQEIPRILWKPEVRYSIIEKNKMGGACSTYGVKKRRIQDFGVETSGKATTWETQA